MAHVLADAGRDPTFLVGGVTLNYGGNFRLGKGEHVVVEGDEYDTAYFDKGPKFLHYRARTALLTSIEFDHADIYDDMPHYEAAFERFCETLPVGGFLGVSASYPRAVEIARAKSKAEVVTYAVNGKADFRADDEEFDEEGAHFTIHSKKEKGRLLLPMSGYHNLENAAGVYAAARSLGLTHKEIARGFASFLGVKRRQEIRGVIGGITVMDDFAHHPIGGIRQRYPERRLWVVFEPRSNTSRRNIHQAEYVTALAGADLATIREPEPHDKVPADQQLNVPRIVEELIAQGVIASSSPNVDELISRVGAEARPNDLLLVMSNGSFGGFIPAVMDALRTRFGDRESLRDADAN
jgi:UDP-N-acetylmuramate: L-alanyl-gamma-D-glutamyl-meso-diaminopimelate ligase